MTSAVIYADVADTLPSDIREAVEVILPCDVALTREHLWDRWPESNEVGVKTGRWHTRSRFCVYCGTVRST